MLISLDVTVAIVSVQTYLVMESQTATMVTGLMNVDVVCRYLCCVAIVIHVFAYTNKLCVCVS